MPELLEEIAWEEEVGNSLVVREPVGVVGAITPWNYPLHQIAAKVAPALAAGCTVVLKPSEVAPLNAFILAEIIEAAGAAGRRLQPRHRHRARGRRGDRRAPGRRHGLVHRLDPRRQARVASSPRRRVKRVALELGGKSPNVILDDADLAQAVADGVAQVLPQLRPDLQRADPHARAARRSSPKPSEIAAAAAEAFTLGDPFEPSDAARPARLRRRSASACAATSAKGDRGGRDARHRRRRGARGPRPRLLRAADGVLRA